MHFLILLCVVAMHATACGATVFPVVKEARVSTDSLDCSQIGFEPPAGLANESSIFLASLTKYGIRLTTGALPLRIRVGEMSPTSSPANHKEGYRLSISRNGLEIQSQSNAGAFYGMQTLSHLLSDGGTSVPVCEIQDWPDLPLRMVMIDPARQNENFDYYRRLVSFCAKQKINAMLLHLTDDQTAALFEPNYPELMHPHAWNQNEARALLEYAKAHHIELTPEIESCGHSRMFIRRDDYPEFLHQTTKQRKPSDWMGTDKPGYTNVLCPASEKAYEYIERMVDAAQVFDSPVVHLGFDEVDMTTCARCLAKWPGKPPEFWFSHQLKRNIEIVQKRGKRAAVWGDMLLKHPALLDGIDPKLLIIYDWQYRPNVKPTTSRFFTSRGFEVIACPSLMCSPHIILPDEQNYNNVRTFARVAREEKLAGLNTTFWLPTRYLSGALWPAFAYVGSQAWGGSNFDKRQCLSAFAMEHFGVRNGAAFTQVWDQLATATIPLREFETALYVDDEGLSAARQLLRRRSKPYSDKIVELHAGLKGLRQLESSVKRNKEDWDAIEHSAEILLFAFDYLDSSGYPGSAGYRKRGYRERAQRALNWIMEDWNRNRYPGDPNLDGTYVTGQNVALRLKQIIGE